MPPCLVFANGELRQGFAVQAAMPLAAAQGCLIIAVDGGVRYTSAFGLHPHIIIGDLDSAPSDLLQQAREAGAQILTYLPEKDETDLELALSLAAEREANPIYLLGALGGRLDQSLSNIHLLTMPGLAGRHVYLMDGNETSWLADPEGAVIRGAIGDTVSLIPLNGDVLNIRTQGLYYPLHGERLRFGAARGVSNLMRSEEAVITHGGGHLLIIHTAGRL
jgi:thiamine pyrophosphokinase